MSRTIECIFAFQSRLLQEQKLVLDLPVDAIIEKSTSNSIQLKGESWMCSFTAANEPTIEDELTKDELLQGAANYFFSTGIRDIESIESVNFTSAEGFQLETNNPDPKKILYFIHTSNKIRLNGYCITGKNKENSAEGVSFDIYQY